MNLHLGWNSDKFARKHLCRKGYHKLRASFVSWGCTSSRMTTVRYLRCDHCEYIFFTSKREKTKYMNMKKRDKAMSHKMFESMLKLPEEHRNKKISKIPEEYG